MSQEQTSEICKHPDKLQGKPGECSPEQIKKCHGEDSEHLCVKEE